MLQDQRVQDRARTELHERNAARIASVGTPNEALEVLKASGASPIEAIAALRLRFGMSVTEGKDALHTHPAWYAEARAAEVLHSQLESALDDFEADTSPPTESRVARMGAWFRRRR